MELQYNDIYYFVYILTNKDHSMLDVGVTGDLRDRLYKVERQAMDQSANGNSCTSLVYVESFPEAQKALFRERKIKGFSTSKKKHLIESFNPGWKSLNHDVYEQTLLKS